MRNLSTILIVLIVLITGCTQTTIPSSQPAPNPDTTVSSSQPTQPSILDATPIAPPIPVEKPTSYESERYTNDTYGFSIRYPKTWSSRKPPLDTSVFMASATLQEPDKLAVVVNIRPATNFKNAARDLMYELLKQRVTQPIPYEAFNVVSENTTQLDDGKTTAYEVCWAIGNYRVYYYGILKDGNAIIVAAGWDADHLDLYKEIIHTLTFK